MVAWAYLRVLEIHLSCVPAAMSNSCMQTLEFASIPVRLEAGPRDGGVGMTQMLLASLFASRAACIPHLKPSLLYIQKESVGNEHKYLPA